MKIVLIRHCAPLIAPGTCYGRLDIRARAEQPAEWAAMLDAVQGLESPPVWTSPSRRCHALAERLAAHHGWTLRDDYRLQELNFGAWEGTRWDDIDRAALESWAADPRGFAPPGGETGAVLLERVRDFHAGLCAANQDGVVVSHGGPLKLLAALLKGEAPDLLAPAPGLGSAQVFEVRALSA